jgi:hypothetical protein
VTQTPSAFAIAATVRISGLRFSDACLSALAVAVVIEASEKPAQELNRVTADDPSSGGEAATVCSGIEVQENRSRAKHSGLIFEPFHLC